LAVTTVWMVEKSAITVSGGGSLDGITQGDGSHLVGRTITFHGSNRRSTLIDDNDASFDDNDASQTLSGAQTIDGVNYASGTRVEAEYTIVLSDALTGKTYTAYGYNVSNSTPGFGTVEGLSFLGGVGEFPPAGAVLTVLSSAEGPGSGVQPPAPYADLVYPPCLTAGTMISVPGGERPIEDLIAGDHVLTRDHGAQPIRWIGRISLSAQDLRVHKTFRPVVLHAETLGPGLPARPLRVSQQHRFVRSGQKAELMFGHMHVLIAARDLVCDAGIHIDTRDAPVTYFHLLFDRHEIIFAEGAETESLFPSGLSDENMPPALLAEINALFPALEADRTSFGPTAHLCLKSWESRLLLA
jgi:Hint domain